MSRGERRSWKRLGVASTGRAEALLNILAVTRPVGEGEETARLIRGLGWRPLIVHSVELRPRERSEIYADLSRILSEGQVDWLVLMSSHGVDLLFDVLKSYGSLLPSALGQLQLLAVGPRTRDALTRNGVQDVYLPERFSSMGVADFLSRQKLGGKRVVLARSSAADDSLARRLEGEGARVDTLRLYDSVIPSDFSTVLRFVDELRKGAVGALLFTSSISVSNLFALSEDRVSQPELLSLLGPVLVGSIGPVTAHRLRRLGVEPKVIPRTFLIEEALREMVSTFETIMRENKAA